MCFNPPIKSIDFFQFLNILHFRVINKGGECASSVLCYSLFLKSLLRFLQPHRVSPDTVNIPAQYLHRVVVGWCILMYFSHFLFAWRGSGHIYACRLGQKSCISPVPFTLAPAIAVLVRMPASAGLAFPIFCKVCKKPHPRSLLSHPYIM